MCGEVKYVALSVDFGGPICGECDRQLYCKHTSAVVVDEDEELCGKCGASIIS